LKKKAFYVNDMYCRTWSEGSYGGLHRLYWTE